LNTPRNIALITSTIAPAANTFLLRHSDPEQRLREYQQAFAFYCQQVATGVFDALIYADNSDYPLDSLVHIAHSHGVQDKTEFVSWRANDSPDNSRFFLELKLINEALTRSQLLQQHPDAFLWKITGRYRIANIGHIVRKKPAEATALYVNSRSRPHHFVDFYLAGFSVRAYHELIAIDLQLHSSKQDDGERILYRRLHDHGPARQDISVRFNVVPRIYGIRGYDGQSYNNWRHTTKYYARVVANLLFPHWWI
jgi:hypothetical protein